jgi:hypothetical protein
MTHSFLRAVAASILACSLSANAAGFTATKYPFNLPPSTELGYSIKSQQKGLAVSGSAIMRWDVAGRKFTATNEVRAMLVGKILDAKTEGSIDSYGLAPASYVEKRFRKEPTTTSFDRTAQTIRFTGSDQTYPIKGGEQDRNSVIWQLASVARAARNKFKPGSEWTFFVAGQRDAEPWTFKVIKQQKLRTPLGELKTLHITRTPPSGTNDQQLDLWLAPQREWYPVRLRFSEDNGDFIEQTLEMIGGKAQ